jgi:hypothetical protein
VTKQGECERGCEVEKVYLQSGYLKYAAREQTSNVVPATRNSLNSLSSLDDSPRRPPRRRRRPTRPPLVLPLVPLVHLSIRPSSLRTRRRTKAKPTQAIESHLAYSHFYKTSVSFPSRRASSSSSFPCPFFLLRRRRTSLGGPLRTPQEVFHATYSSGGPLRLYKEQTGEPQHSPHYPPRLSRHRLRATTPVPSTRSSSS